VPQDEKNKTDITMKQIKQHLTRWATASPNRFTSILDFAPACSSPLSSLSLRSAHLVKQEVAAVFHGRRRLDFSATGELLRIGC